jgi:hypothetical protein
MNPPIVDIFIADRVTDDACAGLAMFAELTQLQPANELPQSWRYWLENTPYGNGLLAVAKHGDEVVGLYALIPLEMRIRGRTVRGAKGEFFAVKPGYRNALHGPSGKLLAFALSHELHRAAGRAAFECLQLVSTPTAAFCHVANGARPLSCEWTVLVSCWSRLPVSRFANRFLNAGASAGAHLYGVLARSVGVLRCRTPRGQPLETPAALLEWPETPDVPHLMYETKDAQGRRAELVFTMPLPNAAVRLKHWSSVQFSPKVLLSIVKDVMARCKAVRASALIIAVPTADAATFKSVAKLGFVRCRKDSRVYLYSPTGMDLDWDPSQWRFTNAHVGLIGGS